MKFLEGAPPFAVEIRSENDYAPSAEKLIAAKIEDHLAAGTTLVWDVALTALETIRAYSSDTPTQPRVFTRREVVDAEPTLPGWRFELDNLFPYAINVKPD